MCRSQWTEVVVAPAPIATEPEPSKVAWDLSVSVLIHIRQPTQPLRPTGWLLSSSFHSYLFSGQQCYYMISSLSRRQNTLSTCFGAFSLDSLDNMGIPFLLFLTSIVIDGFGFLYEADPQTILGSSMVPA
jgi:hypothetical protein